MKTRLRKTLAAVLVVVVPLSLVSRPAEASMLATDVPSAGKRAVVMRALHRADVRSELERLGADPAQVDARVAALTDAEVADLARRIDAAPAGGSNGYWIAIAAVWVLALAVMGVVLVVKGIAQVANAAFDAFVQEAR